MDGDINKNFSAAPDHQSSDQYTDNGSLAYDRDASLPNQQTAVTSDFGTDSTPFTNQARYYRQTNGLTALIIGGVNFRNIKSELPGRNMYRYEPLSNDWKTHERLPDCIHHHCIAYVQGKIFLLG